MVDAEAIRVGVEVLLGTDMLESKCGMLVCVDSFDRLRTCRSHKARSSEEN